MRKLLTILLLSLFEVSLAQDGQFSQYFTTTTLINPAITGIRPEMELSTNYKRGGTLQSDNFFELAQATFIYPLKTVTSQEHQIGGIGGTFFRERRGFQGIFTSQKFLLTGAYTIRLNQLTNSFVAFGLQGGVIQNRISDEALQWGSQFNRFLGFDQSLPGETVNLGTVTFPTANFGVVYTVYDNENIFIRDKSLTVGLSAENLNRPKTGDDADGSIRKNILYKAFGSIKLGIGPRFSLHPSTLILSEGNRYQLNVGTYISTVVNSARSRTSILLQVGSWYRQGDSFIVMSGFQIQQLKIGVSFDLNSETFTSNEVFRQIDQSYEVSLTYTFARADKVRKVSNPIF